ncbi:MAG TPA: S46 family peptidase [Bacteroidales bacterium]|nr:S46 family peptidase [Bacteroidales bacterium]
MKRTILVFTLLTSFFLGFADAGMWLPILLNKNEAEMQKLGFKLTAEDVYSVNHSSLKDAVVLFGGGCTAELISKNGLLLTNHHCGYSYIQRYSTLENNYLHNGFWAKSYDEEIPCEGLTVSFLIKMEDVTVQVLDGVSPDQSLPESQNRIKKNIDKVISEYTKETTYRADVKPFYYGNQYFIFVYQVYKDVRLVGTPPENIGKFGGDTDNWVWPRHTGDFSLYRIYTAPNGQAAQYSPDNIPMNSPKYLPISVSGVDEGDFTMVLGYPGTTMQYLLSDGVDLVVNTRNPVAIHQRGVRLDIMKKYMNQSTEIRLMYSAKSNSIANGWKKWIGENKGIKDSKVIQKKQNEETQLQQMIDQNPNYAQKYKNVIQNIKDDYAIYQKLELQSAFLRETFPAVELPAFAERFRKNFYINGEMVNFDKDKEKWINYGENFYSHYYKPIDKEVFVELLFYYFNTLDVQYMPETLQKYAKISKENLLQLSDNWYEKSIFANKESYMDFMKNAKSKDFKKLKKWFDENQFFLQASIQLGVLNGNKIPTLKVLLEEHYRIYLQCLMELDPQRVKFPDANLTMRVAYGTMQGIIPADGMKYLPFTTVSGIIDKEDPDIFDYKVDPKLKELILTKNFGSYADKNGDMRVAFIASNHTTGGNSGSPILNGKGELVGINFDRMWEGTMSDLHYDVNKCRNISLDIRYVLFIIDKFADAQNIIKELDIKE